MSYVKAFVLNWKDRLALGFLYLAVTWVILAMIFAISMASLEFAGKTEITRDISNWISWRIDGTFKNSSENIFYVAEDHIWVESVENKVKIGKLAGNRNLAFGVKNILEEYVQEKGYDLSQDAQYKLKVSIVYLDVLTTKTNISVFHKGEEEVVVRLQGILYK